jgi:hypothetical protein
MLNVIILSIVMLSVIYTDGGKYALFAECHYPECHYAE